MTAGQNYSSLLRRSNMPTIQPRNDLATHASTVALTPARALTSYLRWIYSARYEGKVANPLRAFTFDLSLIAVIVAFVIGAIYVWLRPAPDAQLWKLSVHANALRSLEPSAIEANVTWSGDRTQQHVRLQWDIPEGTTVLASDRTISQDGFVDLGTLKKGDTVSSRIVARFYAPAGQVALRFRVFYDQGVLAGTESRSIEGSAVRLEQVFNGDALTPNAVMPFILKSETAMPIEGLQLTATNGRWHDGESVTGLASTERRIVFFVPSSTSAEVGLQAHAVPVLSQSLSFLTTTTRAITVGRLFGDEQKLSVDVTALQPGELYLFHPSFEHGFTKRDINAGQQTITVALPTKATAGEWSVMPVWRQGAQNVIGDWSRATITAPLSLEASIRYFAASGDQLGVGPLPPVVGQSTRYWLQWRLAPRSDELKAITIKAVLPTGVHWTGNSALPVGGTVSEEGGLLVYKLESLPAQTDGIAAIELEFTPVAAMRGVTPYLLNTSEATATDARTFETVATTHPALDTSLPEDERAKGHGLVE